MKLPIRLSLIVTDIVGCRLSNRHQSISGGGYQFQRGGVYVITHALQEIGFALAEHLVREFECKVVLLARSFFPRPQEWDAVGSRTRR